jgi:hypothetical protein
MIMGTNARSARDTTQITTQHYRRLRAGLVTTGSRQNIHEEHEGHEDHEGVREEDINLNSIGIEQQPRGARLAGCKGGRESGRSVNPGAL